MGKTFRRFEEIDAWQHARSLTRDIYLLTDIKPFAVDFALKDQIRRSAISMMSNIAEGVVRNRPAEFVQFLSYSKASCAELRSQLYVAFDVGHISEQTCCDLQRRADDVARLIHGLTRYLISVQKREKGGGR